MNSSLRTSFLVSALFLTAAPALAQTTIYVPSQTQRFGGTTLYSPQPQSYGVPLGYFQQGQIPATAGQTGYYGQVQPGFGQTQQGTVAPNVVLPGQARSIPADDLMTQGRARTDSSNTSRATGPTIVPTAPAQSERREPRGRRFAGPAKVIDGNTLIVAGEVLVLNGADAPELGQVCSDLKGFGWNCGDRSRDRLINLVSTHPVTCSGVGAAQGGTAATCRVGQTDLGRQLVLEGLAVVPRTVAPVYLAEEASARSAQRGVWAGKFKSPWEARAGK
ncbi:hypothetical protein BSY19_5251 (plasmid) [Bosea sp. RAC05]|nr:hypothetical protein BSY19_5251 [Bosea sp. RAC05]